MVSETTPTHLQRIVAVRQAAVAHRKRVVPLPVLRLAVERQPAAERVRDFAAALTAPGLRIIAELKQASPSAGQIRSDYRPAELARELAAAGAAALSVLTEEEFFQGSIEHLRQARQAVDIPVLRKDFIVDPWQVWETRAAGADSFLLIAGLLEGPRLAEMIELGRSLGMEPLVEVHDRAQLQQALEAGARLIGVNNRDLHTLTVRPETSYELARWLPADCIAVSESGLSDRGELERLRQAGYRAFLVGESLMRAPAPGQALRGLLGEV